MTRNDGRSGPVDDAALAAARVTLHRIAGHVLGRRRFEVSGRFGLRSSPGGIATPAFGEGPEVVRIAGTILVREVGGEAGYTAIPGSTLARLAAAAGCDLGAEFSAGGDTPPLGDPDERLELDPKAAAALADWFALGAGALDAALAGLPGAAPSTVQIWPEHFDAGTTVTLDSGDKCNLGASPGDGFEPAPYLYVGPWGAARPGDPSFWNAPFGAVLRRADVLADADPLDRAVTFLETGLELADPG